MPRFIVATVICMVLAGCTVLPDKPGGTPSAAFVDTGDTTLGKLAVGAHRDNAEVPTSQSAKSPSATSQSSETSAICILDRNEEAFVSRIAMIDLAERSIDLQTFCWAADRSSRLLADHLLRAADRGVRIRLLLDDLDVRGRDFNIALLDAYPNVEIRLWNPFRMRFFWRLGAKLEMLLNLDRLDHRMHNKTFVADNQAAIVGGRNVGDEYFGVSKEYDYRDFDLMVFGPAAAQVSECFDAYWADPRSYPAHDVAPREFKKVQLDEGRAKLSAYIQSQCADFPYHLPDSRDDAQRYLTDALGAAVRAPTQMLFDDPRKGDIDRHQPSDIRRVLSRTEPQSEIVLMNPYFIPQKKFVAALAGAKSRGVQVRVLTNSLASTDVISVHSAYVKRRQQLLEGGVTLCELRPDAQDRGRYIAASCPNATLALHAKVLVIDRSRVFVGSMNLDPRSHRLNTEGGMLIDCPELARQVAAKLDESFDPANCWQLGRRGKQMIWQTTRDGTSDTSTSDPDVSGWKGFKCALIGLLPIEDEL